MPPKHKTIEVNHRSKSNSTTHNGRWSGELQNARPPWNRSIVGPPKSFKKLRQATDMSQVVTLDQINSRYKSMGRLGSDNNYAGLKELSDLKMACEMSQSRAAYSGYGRRRRSEGARRSRASSKSRSLERRARVVKQKSPQNNKSWQQ